MLKEAIKGGRRYATTTLTRKSEALALSPVAQIELPRLGPRSSKEKNVVNPRGLGPLQKYEQLVAEGKLLDDEYQRRMLGQLNYVYENLRGYVPAAVPPRDGGGLLQFTSKYFTFFTQHHGPQGIYLYGDVGCGKTMLMDLFYDTIPTHLTKMRIHFHQFMQNVHKREHVLKMAKSTDTIEKISRELSAKAQVLCFDEIQVTDVADAMILRSLFRSLYEKGVVSFFTSNRAPNELYKNGVQRESFLPCIDLILQRHHVVNLVSPTDYRKLPRPASGSYLINDPSLSPAENKNRASAHANEWFHYFAGSAQPEFNKNLEVWGRAVPIPMRAGTDVARFTFQELCGRPLSAADYLEICRTFRAVVLTDIPELSLEQVDPLRRFITFIDAAYDSQLKLAMCAAKPFANLFNTEHSMIDVKSNEVEFAGVTSDTILHSANFPGAEEMFAFARALSRIKQMGTAEWLDLKGTS